MKFSMVRASWLSLVCFFVFACKENKQEQDRIAQNIAQDTIRNEKDLPCDKEFVRIFQQLTSYDTTVDKRANIEREITKETEVKNITEYFHNYVGTTLGIDTSRNSRPLRLNLGVEFNGNTLMEWMTRMAGNGANKIKVLFGQYTRGFLLSHVPANDTEEYNSRFNRFTAILVAYKVTTTTKADGTKDVTEEFKGGYNLGGMQP